jgi:hypothetical protein
MFQSITQTQLLQEDEGGEELYNLLLREKRIVETIIYFIYQNH